MQTVAHAEEGVINRAQYFSSYVEGEITVANTEPTPAVAVTSNNPFIAYDPGTNEFTTVVLLSNTSTTNFVSVTSANGTQRRIITSSTATAPTSWYVAPHNSTATTITSNVYINSNWMWTTAGVYTPSEVDWDRIRKEARAPVVKKSTRNSIKRALKLMTGLGFEEDVRVFLKGDSIEVAHPDSLLKFVITKYERSLIRNTEYPGYSTPYRLQLYTKSDVHVANLCVYMEETPVLDQVLGVAMFIKSGSEEMILKQANWSALTSDMELREILALEYPYLEKKLRLNERRIENVNHYTRDTNTYIEGMIALG